jgi:RHS repeat-associated protein
LAGGGRQSNGSTIENRHFISAGGVGVIGVVKTYGLNNPNVGADPNHVNYWHKDHLGSLVAVSNASGAVLERMAYDAWGKRMQPNGTADPDGQLNPASTDRGFTGHEHLDELGFVHMNGRIDDPLLGRFLSPDPHIQDEGLLQNYNRYSYVLNNPLRYTDPSGELWEIVAFIVGAALASSNNRDLKIVGTFLMMWALGPGAGTEPGLLMQAGASKGLAYSLAAGISNTIAYGPEAGLKAGAFAAAFVFVGANIPGAMSPERIIAHAVLGCVQQASSGGQCGPGAAAAAFGKIATGLTQDWGGAAQFAVTTVVGGTVSVIGGGKFANGAAQAGFGYLFNALTGPPRPGDGTIDAKIKSVVMRGDVQEMRAMMESGGEAFSPVQREFLERAIYRAELTGSRLGQEAARNGFDKVVKDPPFNPHGQKVFTDGKSFLTRDVDSHSGGVWKMFDRSGNRIGTFDQNLVKIAK